MRALTADCLSYSTMNAIPKWSRWSACFTGSVFFHALVIIGVSTVLADRASFEMGRGTAVEVELVAHAAPAVTSVLPSEPIPVPPEPEPVRAIEEKPEFPVPAIPTPRRAKKVERTPDKKPEKKVATKVTQPAPPNAPAANAATAPSHVANAATGPVGSAGEGAVAGSTRAVADYLSNPPPPYPAVSRRLKEEGRVLLKVKVDSSGVVEDVAVKETSGFGRLDEAALKAVGRWKFKPSRFGGIAIDDTVEVPIRFELR